MVFAIDPHQHSARNMRLLWCLRAAVTVAFASAWSLHPNTRSKLAGTLLVPVFTIFGSAQTSGECIAFALGVLPSAVLGSTYAIIYQAIFPEPDPYSTAIALFLWIFTVIYCFPAPFRKGAMAITSVTLITVYLRHLAKLPKDDYNTPLQLMAVAALSIALGPFASLILFPVTTTSSIHHRFRGIAAMVSGTYSNLVAAYATHGTSSYHSRVYAVEVQDTLAALESALNGVQPLLLMAKLEPRWYLWLVNLWHRWTYPATCMPQIREWYDAVTRLLRIAQFAALAEQRLRGTPPFRWIASNLSASLSTVAEETCKGVEIGLAAARGQATMEQLRTARTAIFDAVLACHAKYSVSRRAVMYAASTRRGADEPLLEDLMSSAQDIPGLAEVLLLDAAPSSKRNPATEDIEAGNSFVFGILRAAQRVVQALDKQMVLSDPRQAAAAAAKAKAAETEKKKKKKKKKQAKEKSEAAKRGGPRFKLPPINSTRVKLGLQVAFAVTATSTLALVNDVRIALGNLSIWALVTITFVAGDTIGGSMQQSMVRWHGTAAGCIFGYIVFRHAASEPWVLGAVLSIWVALCTYIRANPKFGYTAVVASFSAAVIILTVQTDTGVSAQTISIQRIESTVYGILIFVIVANFVFPRRASFLARLALQETLHSGRTLCRAAMHTLLLATDAQDETTLPAGNPDDGKPGVTGESHLHSHQHDHHHHHHHHLGGKLSIDRAMLARRSVSPDMLEASVEDTQTAQTVFEAAMMQLPSLIQEAAQEPRCCGARFHGPQQERVVVLLGHVRLFTTIIWRTVQFAEAGLRRGKSVERLADLLRESIDDEEEDGDDGDDDDEKEAGSQDGKDAAEVQPAAASSADDMELTAVKRPVASRKSDTGEEKESEFVIMGGFESMAHVLEQLEHSIGRLFGLMHDVIAPAGVTLIEPPRVGLQGGQPEVQMAVLADLDACVAQVATAAQEFHSSLHRFILARRENVIATSSALPDTIDALCMYTTAFCVQRLADTAVTLGRAMRGLLAKRVGSAVRRNIFADVRNLQLPRTRASELPMTVDPHSRASVMFSSDHGTPTPRARSDVVVTIV